MLWLLWLIPMVGGYSLVFQCPEMCLCDSEITSCQYSGLTELPSDINFNVASLDLSYNNFEIFPAGIGTYSELKYLNISHNRISTLKLSDLEGLENLERLDLTFNLFHDWKDIHSSTFLATKNLKFLDFSSNPLRSIPKYSNHLYIESLEVIRLTNCSMKTIPVNVFNRLTNLKELYLSDNPITSINETFRLENLKLMDISGCRLNFLEENVFSNMTNLEMLILNRNVHLKRFNCHSNSLLYLDLSDCMLERIPSGYMRKLIRLNLVGNYLKMIPMNSFMYFFSLQTLNLSTNAITGIHEQAFEGLTEVITIDLSFNKLTSLSEKLLSNNSALTYLNLSHNYINSLDTISSRSLKMLTASFCEIYEINRYSLALMPSLVTLILSRNFLTTLPNRLIGRSLGILDVSYCRIRALNNETFEETFYLRQINLASNALTSIDPAYFPRAFNVIIKDNPWRCDCPQLKRMFEWMTTYSASRLNDLICNSPEKVEALAYGFTRRILFDVWKNESVPQDKNQSVLDYVYENCDIMILMYIISASKCNQGKTWEQACINEWYPNRATKDTMWYYSLGIVIAMIVALFALVVLRKIKSIQEKQIRLQEEERRVEEREALRRMQERQRELQEEEDRNAPDPRDLQRPPSYNEALLLPRVGASQPNLAGSVHSFGSRGSLRGSSADIAKKNRIRRKRRRRKSEEERRASRITIDSDSSEEYQSMDNLSTRRKLPQAPPLESDF